MTAEYSGGERTIRMHHGATYQWGRVHVSMGAAAVFQLRPLRYDEMGYRSRLILWNAPRIAHPPLEIILATSSEASRSLIHNGLNVRVTGEPQDPDWEIAFWGDSPPPTNYPESVAYNSAHGFSAMVDQVVSTQLPALLTQEGRPPVDLHDAERYAAILGRVAGSGIHRLYCADGHLWPV